jgi:hypothetical protein
MYDGGRLGGFERATMEGHRLDLPICPCALCGVQYGAAFPPISHG